MLIVEDGSVVAGANTFISDVDFTDYCTARGLSFPATAELREPLIINGADYVDSFRNRYQGTKASSEQELQFPRDNVVIDGFALANNAIPILLKNAQAQAAFDGQAQDLQAIQGQNIKKEKVDVIEVEYQDGDGSRQKTTFTKVNSFLMPLFKVVANVVVPFR